MTLWKGVGSIVFLWSLCVIASAKGWVPRNLAMPVSIVLTLPETVFFLDRINSRSTLVCQEYYIWYLYMVWFATTNTSCLVFCQILRIPNRCDLLNFWFTTQKIISLIYVNTARRPAQKSLTTKLFLFLHNLCCVFGSKPRKNEQRKRLT